MTAPAIAPAQRRVGAPVLRTAAVVKRWGNTVALNGATMSIGPGVTGLLGANGSGKTTLLGLFLGLTKPDSGRIQVLGLDPNKAGASVRARVGYSPEHHLLPPDVKAYDFVRHIAELHGLPRRDATARASDALFQVGLGEERLRPIGTMSTGQRQRVKLAQAIVHDPVLVLLDEPTEGLDPVQRDDMLGLIRRIGADFGIHVVLSSHVLDEVERVADHAVILHRGRVIAAGSLDDLRLSGRGMVLELDGDSALVVEALQRSGCSVIVEGLTLLISRGDDDVADLVRDVLAHYGASVRRLSRRTMTLEDVFLGAYQ
jgi:ABC-2 type transport system ATP-binding protein